MLRQIHFSTVDLELHGQFVPGDGETVFARDQVSWGGGGTRL